MEFCPECGAILLPMNKKLNVNADMKNLYLMKLKTSMKLREKQILKQK